MNKKLKVIVLFLLACVMLINVPYAFDSVVYAVTQGDIDDKKDELDDIKDKLEMTQEELKKYEKEQEALGNEIAALLDAISKQADELYLLEESLQATYENIDKLNADIVKIEEEMVEQKENMDNRLRTMYKTNVFSYFELIFNAESLSDFFYRIRLSKELMSLDRDVLGDYKKSRDEIIQKQDILNDQEESIIEQQDIITAKKEALEAVEAEKKDKMELLTSEEQLIRIDFDLMMAEEEKLQQELNRLVEEKKAEDEKKRKEEEERKKREEEAAKLKGDIVVDMSVSKTDLCWPVPGHHAISSKYGMRWHPFRNGYYMHNGIDVCSTYKVSINKAFVRAVDSGKVTLAKYYGTFGNCVMIDHGNGMVTLYAHASELLVKAGQYVVKGQKIMKVGSTGSSNAPHLHFEIRINNKPVDPFDKYFINTDT